MKTRSLIFLFLILDLVILNFLMLLISFIHYYGTPTDIFRAIANLMLLFSCGWFLSTVIFIDDMRNLKLGLSIAFKTQLKKMVVFISIVSVAVISFKLNEFSRIIFFSTTGFFILIKFAISLWFYYYYSLKDHFSERNTLIIGNTKIGNELFRYFQKFPCLGLNPIGILDQKSGVRYQGRVIGSICDFSEILETRQLLDVIITLPLSDMDIIKELIFIAEKNGVKSHIVPNYYGVIDRPFKVNMFGSVPMLNLRCVPLDFYPNKFWKRSFDLFFGTFILIAISPLLLLIAILIRIETEGSILYKPVRLGMNGKPFVLYKFRSMYMNDDALKGDKSTGANDERVTKLGKILRKFNLDELPQLINVLNNEMSLVGPRPHRVNLNMTLKQKMNSYMIRHWVKPGITGWAQVNGWRGPTEDRLQYTARTLHDLWYIENWNFALDLYIIFQTIFGKKARNNAF